MKQDRSLCNEGTVSAVDDKYIYVEITVLSACSGCHVNSICLSSQRRGELIKIDNSGDETFHVGESVIVYMQEKLGTLAVFIGYLFPFLILAGTFILIYNLTLNELLGFVVAVSLTAAYYGIIALINRKKKIDRQFIFSLKKRE